MILASTNISPQVAYSLGSPPVLLISDCIIQLRSECHFFKLNLKKFIQLCELKSPRIIYTRYFCFVSLYCELKICFFSWCFHFSIFVISFTSSSISCFFSITDFICSILFPSFCICDSKILLTIQIPFGVSLLKTKALGVKLPIATYEQYPKFVRFMTHFSCNFD